MFVQEELSPLKGTELYKDHDRLSKLDLETNTNDTIANPFKAGS